MLSGLSKNSYLLLFVCFTSLAAPKPPVLKEIRHLPVYFEPNRGQVDPAVKFVARTPGQTVFLTENSAVLSVKGHAPIRMRFHGAARFQEAHGAEAVPAVSNYLTGNQSSQYRTGIPQFTKVRYREMYPGIDVVYYGNDRSLEYDMVVAPGANPGLIDLAYEGAKPQLAADGDLLLSTKGLDMRQHRPKVYQDLNGRRVEVAASYRLQPGGH